MAAAAGAVTAAATVEVTVAAAARRLTAPRLAPSIALGIPCLLSVHQSLNPPAQSSREDPMWKLSDCPKLSQHQLRICYDMTVLCHEELLAMTKIAFGLFILVGKGISVTLCRAPSERW